MEEKKCCQRHTWVNWKMEYSSRVDKKHCVCQSLSYVQLFETPWTVACQATLSMEFTRQDYGVGCHSLQQGIFLTQGSNPGLLHSGQILHHLESPGNHCTNTLIVELKFTMSKFTEVNNFTVVIWKYPYSSETNSEVIRSKGPWCIQVLQALLFLQHLKKEKL